MRERERARKICHDKERFHKGPQLKQCETERERELYKRESWLMLSLLVSPPRGDKQSSKKMLCQQHPVLKRPS